jgi:hypothetical protein
LPKEKTAGPQTVSGPFVGGQNQQHFADIDSGGAIWDSFYLYNNNSWNLQKINDGGKTTATLFLTLGKHRRQIHKSFFFDFFRVPDDSPSRATRSLT